MDGARGTAAASPEAPAVAGRFSGDSGGILCAILCFVLVGYHLHKEFHGQQRFRRDSLGVPEEGWIQDRIMPIKPTPTIPIRTIAGCPFKIA
jgi:hypothetical protein